jgi:hypothetical protein
VLSGHTHGGQVTFFGLWAPYLPSDYGQKYRTGLVVTENTTVIVSNGIGTIFPPIRFFAPPQIVEIILQSSPAASSSSPTLVAWPAIAIAATLSLPLDGPRDPSLPGPVGRALRTVKRPKAG